MSHHLARPGPEVLLDLQVYSPFPGRRDKAREVDSFQVMLTCDTKVQTLGFLKITISRLNFSWYIFSSSLICPSSIHFGNSCFEPLVGVSLVFTGHISLFQRFHGTLWIWFNYSASKISATKYDISCNLMKMLFYYVARSWVYSSPKYLDRPWKCSQLRQVWCVLMTKLIQLFSFDFLSPWHV